MKTSNAVALQYEDLTVHFTGDAWFNATEAAAKYEKRPNDWLALDGTREYILAVQQMFNYQSEWYLKTTRGKNGGTWLHPKLAVHFARWLDVRFSIWCDMQIDSLIRGTHSHSNPPREKLVKEKRGEALPMTDAKMFAYDRLGLVFNGGAEGPKEHQFCNRALTGKWDALDESTLDNYDLKLLKAIRRYNTMLIPYYPRQKDKAADGKSRYELMEDFVADYRTKHPILTLATLDGKTVTEIEVKS
jgi:hypothetical protein